MRRPTRILSLLPAVLALFWAAAPVYAQLQVRSARIEVPSTPARADLVPWIPQQADGWFAWTVAATPDHGPVCCAGGLCALSGDGLTLGQDESDGPAGELAVFVRNTSGEIAAVRAVSAGCEVDAGGAAVRWLREMDADTSVEILASALAGEAGSEALAAVALHGSPAADGVLAEVLESSPSLERRREAARWLATARGASELSRLIAATRSAPPETRRAALYGLAFASGPEAADALLYTALHDDDADLRGDAWRWLARREPSDPEGVLVAVRESLASDPSSAVQERALDALAELPPETARPVLLRTAQEHPRVAVRKRATDLLARSGDVESLRELIDPR